MELEVWVTVYSFDFAVYILQILYPVFFLFLFKSFLRSFDKSFDKYFCNCEKRAFN